MKKSGKLKGIRNILPPPAEKPEPGCSGWTRDDYRLYRSHFIKRRTVPKEKKNLRYGTWIACLSNARKKDWTWEYIVPCNPIDYE